MDEKKVYRGIYGVYFIGVALFCLQPRQSDY